jgi:hypothetical protein
MTTDERSVKFTTGCQPCIFAEVYDGQQIGCDFNRLEKYIQQGKAELNADDENASEVYNEDGSDPAVNNTGYYTIKTICNTCRGEEWANKHIGRNLIAAVEDEIKIPLDFILMSIDDSAEEVLKKLPDLVKQCVNQDKIKPKKIILVLRNSNIKSSEVNDVLRECCDEVVEYQLIRVLDFTADIHRCLDMGVQKSDSRYYAVYGLGNSIPKNLILVLNDLINNQLKSVSMIEPICGFNGMIVQSALHRIFGGNRAMPLYEKVVDAAKIQDRMDNIFTWEQLWKREE